MRFTFVDERQFCRRAAHVEGQHFIHTGLAAEIGGDQRASRRAGFEQLYRRPFCLCDMGQTAIRQHHEIGCADTERRSLVDQAIDINVRQRFHIGICYRRRGSGVFPDFRRDIVRCGDDQVGMLLGNCSARGILMCRVGVGVQEDDRYRFRPRGAQRVDLLQKLSLVERRDFAAVRRHTFGHFEP